MVKKLIILLLVFLNLNIYVNCFQIEQLSTEQVIRNVICETENKNYVKAQNNLEKILQKEPQNIYAQRLLPGVLMHQIKEGNKSQANIAQIKKTTEAFENYLNTSELSILERRYINTAIIKLYEKINEEEKTKFLLKKSEDTNLSSEERNLFYITLAAQYNSCANEITENSTVKKTVRKGGKEVYIFTKPKSFSEFNKLKDCTAKGMELIDKVIDLEKQSGKETSLSWSYKGSLLIQKIRIAEMEGKQQEKESLQNELELARQRFIDLSRDKTEAIGEIVETPNREVDINQLTKELISYKIEIPLDKLVKEIYIPSDYLVAPIPAGKDNPLVLETKKTQNRKPDWKVFSPNGEFSAELPDNAETFIGGDSPIYEASSENVRFMIHTVRRIEQQTPDLDDKVINMLAWSSIIPIGNLSVGNYSANQFEISFVRKEKISGHPAKIYKYVVNSCKEKKIGTFIVLLGKQFNYVVNISADEQNVQSQRFIKSLRIIE